MEFFQQLFSMGEVNLTIRIMKKNDKLTLSVMPGHGPSAGIRPITVTGTPAELDAEFFTAIAPGIQEVAGLVTNIDAVKKEAKDAADKAKPVEKPKVTQKSKKDVKGAKKKTETVVETSMFTNDHAGPVMEAEIEEETEEQTD